MDSQKIAVYAVVVILGLAAGSLGPQIIEEYNSIQEQTDQDVESLPDAREEDQGPNYTKVEGKVISQDPNFTSFDQIEPPEDALTFWDIPRRNGSETYGPWRATTFRYVPNVILQRVSEREGSRLIINSGPLGESNVFQKVTVPENSDSYVLMEGRSASDLILGNQCTEMRGFVEVAPWTGNESFAEAGNDNIIAEESVRKNMTFGAEVEPLEMDIPERMNGEEVVIFGGVSTKSYCREAPVNHFQINRFLLADRNG